MALTCIGTNATVQRRLSTFRDVSSLMLLKNVSNPRSLDSTQHSLKSLYLMRYKWRANGSLRGLLSSTSEEKRIARAKKVSFYRDFRLEHFRDGDPPFPAKILTVEVKREALETR